MSEVSSKEEGANKWFFFLICLQTHSTLANDSSFTSSILLFPAITGKNHVPTDSRRLADCFTSCCQRDIHRLPFLVNQTEFI